MAFVMSAFFDWHPIDYEIVENQRTIRTPLYWLHIYVYGAILTSSCGLIHSILQIHLVVPRRTIMRLYETENGDRWVCIYCQKEEATMIEEKKWEVIFDRDEPLLRCFLCKKPDFDFDD